MKYGKQVLTQWSVCKLNINQCVCVLAVRITSDLHQLCLCVPECSSFIWRQGCSQAARPHSYNTELSRALTEGGGKQGIHYLLWGKTRHMTANYKSLKSAHGAIHYPAGLKSDHSWTFYWHLLVTSRNYNNINSRQTAAEGDTDHDFMSRWPLRDLIWACGKEAS